MISGVITCRCGQLFGFETEQERVVCQTCGKEFQATDYSNPEPVEESVPEE